MLNKDQIQRAWTLLLLSIINRSPRSFQNLSTGSSNACGVRTCVRISFSGKLVLNVNDEESGFGHGNEV